MNEEKSLLEKQNELQENLKQLSDADTKIFEIVKNLDKKLFEWDLMIFDHFKSEVDNLKFIGVNTEEIDSYFGKEKMGKEDIDLIHSFIMNNQKDFSEIYLRLLDFKINVGTTLKFNNDLSKSEKNKIEKDKIEEDIQKLNEKIKDLLSKNSKYERTIADLNTENTEIKVKNTELEKNNAELKGKNTGLEKKNTELDKNNTELKVKNTELEEKDNKLKNDVDSFGIVIAEINQKVQEQLKIKLEIIKEKTEKTENRK